ncbi:MAG: outer membrane lipid asymmetry maintenance protein MlaD [Rhodospirillales bacterium]|nr:MAG: outer membrane lipid asymmetry maintenance protein MlaD [Rhodospirillales bacterium]
MQRHVIESVMGAVVILVAAGFTYIALDTARVGTRAGYPVTAEFFRIGGLTVGSDVRLSGIKVGTVSETRLDPDTFDAVVVMIIDHGVSLPEDTVAGIESQGILGGKYVRLQPGSAEARIAAGGRIENTQPFRSLEDQVGEIIFLATTPAGDRGNAGPSSP